MNINLHNAKAVANLCEMSFFDNEAEWGAYLAENPELKDKIRYSPEDRFDGKSSSIKVFSEAVEYIPRSLRARPMQTFIARNLITLLTSERKSRVLDYGCGAGNMGVLFSQAGFKVDLVEVEGVITDFLQWRVRRHFLNCRILKENEAIGKYDLAIFFNVLEHLEAPDKVLEKITESLGSGGYLALLFNTSESGLDIVSWERWEKELKPYLLSNYRQIEDTDQMLYQKK